MSLILKHEQHKFEDYSGDGMFSSIFSLGKTIIPKGASFVSNNKSLISSEAKAVGSIAEAGKSISDTVKQSNELKELQLIRDLRNRRRYTKIIMFSSWITMGKYPREKHLPGHNYTGPGTRLDLRLDKNDKPKPVGDGVRIFKYKSKFEKGYVGYWTNEMFIVDKVNTTSPPTYELIDQDKEQIIGENEDTFQQELNALETKLNSELQTKKY
ncbi:hypothetical protein LOTGIDRAFT_157250 [Lottia gigantea]|uniref:Uncharacterized protein n=1 Tax=Lottia gigantea TaxID=225164 RepID=V4B3W7_LOTGI|nr:hypothetical protein LOTGIDRAFT_157250 [Lottia gigantea]ESP02101.1 hypothetical protein LOTGIDRAFT_157250 [Lottia gigantea]